MDWLQDDRPKSQHLVPLPGGAQHSATHDAQILDLDPVFVPDVPPEGGQHRVCLDHILQSFGRKREVETKFVPNGTGGIKSDKAEGGVGRKVSAIFCKIHRPVRPETNK